MVNIARSKVNIGRSMVTTTPNTTTEQSLSGHYFTSVVAANSEALHLFRRFFLDSSYWYVSTILWHTFLVLREKRIQAAPIGSSCMMILMMFGCGFLMLTAVQRITSHEPEERTNACAWELEQQIRCVSWPLSDAEFKVQKRAKYHPNRNRHMRILLFQDLNYEFDTHTYTWNILNNIKFELDAHTSPFSQELTL